jgi:hypothetical protein
MNLNSKGGVRAAQILALIVVGVVVVGGLVWGAVEVLRLVEIVGRLD